MKTMRWYKILGRYLWQHLSLALIFIIFIVIFSSIFRLYELEVEAVLYAAGLCTLFALVVFSVQFFFYVRNHQERMRLLKNIRLLAEELPEPKTLAEDDFQKMIHELKQSLETSEMELHRKCNESLDYYTTWVHQIKTPISTMKMILESEDTDEHRDLLAELFRIEQYVEMVLTYLRLGSETSDYVFKECDLDKIIRQAIHKYAAQFIRHKIQLNYNPVNMRVLTDEKWLLFIIEQILSNSIKYTQQGSITISTSAHKVLKIADTGIGIAPEDVPRIFDKGFTGYNGRYNKKATGIGLYLCKTAADKLSHEICVESTPGVGTVIFINLHTNKLILE